MAEKKRILTKNGDVFAASLGDGGKKYFQYVANDLTQLNSDVIRVFKTFYAADETPNLPDVVNGEVEFYAHCVIKWGVKLGYWEKVGKTLVVGEIDVLFGDTNDAAGKIGELVEISDKWYVWRIGEEFRRVGKLEGENRNAEIGIVCSPDKIVGRMKSGKYDLVYPRYK